MLSKESRSFRRHRTKPRMSLLKSTHVSYRFNRLYLSTYTYFRNKKSQWNGMIEEIVNKNIRYVSNRGIDHIFSAFTLAAFHYGRDMKKAYTYFTYWIEVTSNLIYFGILTFQKLVVWIIFVAFYYTCFFFSVGWIENRKSNIDTHAT